MAYSQPIADVLRETRAGFNIGKVVLEGIGDYKGRSAYVEFQNENLTVTVDGENAALTPKEYDILRFLMKNAGTVFSPSEIYRRVWDDVPLNAAGAIAVHIRHLREKIEINPSEPRYIKVVWGKGYKMEGGIK